MTWYAAHAIIAYTIKGDPNPQDIDVYENVYLIEAPDTSSAFKMATEIAQNAALDDPTFTIDDKPGLARFVGIRKLVTVSNRGGGHPNQDRPTSGSEITYSRFEVENEEQLQKLASDETVQIYYCDG